MQRRTTIGQGTPVHDKPPDPTTRSPRPLGWLVGTQIQHTVFERRVFFSNYLPSPAPSVIARLVQARSWLVFEIPSVPSPSRAAFLHLDHHLPPDPSCSPCCYLGSSACTVPSARNSSHCCSPITLLRETPPSQPPLYIPSQPCLPPSIALITLHVCLCD